MLEEGFNRYIREHSLAGHEDKILLAVSGGVDSMVMMSLFISAGYNVGVAHCNYQLRGEESEEDEQLVKREAEKYGIPHFNRRFDVKAETEATGESLQMATRRQRYTWFNELCVEHGYTAISIAHHADDSIETFFINLMRGTGLRGLTGIHRVNGRIIRPLLFASRKEILEYAHQHGIPFREDSSNRTTKYLRNKIRLGIVPVLRDINPKFTSLMGKNIDRLTDAQLFIESSIDMIRKQVVTEEYGVVRIEPVKIDRSLPVGFVLYEILNIGYGFKGDVVDGLCEALRKEATGKRFYSKDYVAYVDRGGIIVTAIDEGDACQTEITPDQHRAYYGGSIMMIRNTDIDNVETLVVPENMAMLDAAKLIYPLHIRRWRDGDHFIPFGMENNKKISDFLIDAKVSAAQKKRQFVLVNGNGEIVWLIGRRIDQRYSVGKDTEGILHLITELI